MSLDNHKAKPLAGRIALVTGSGRGIGRSVARELAELGASVAVLARSEPKVSEAARELTAEGFPALAVCADVADWAQVQSAVQLIHARWGSVDILVNNAAVLGPLAPTASTDPALWAHTINVNVTGAYHCLRAVLPGMQARGWGRIVNVTSGAARGSGIQNAGAYSVSKAALDMLTRAAAAETAASGVLINGVSPGVVDTDMQSALRTAPIEEIGAATSERFRAFHARGELQTPARPARLIAAVVLSDAHGETISIRDERAHSLLALLPDGSAS